MKPTARLRRIERTREGLIERVGEMEEGLLDFQPEPDKWSIREIVEHLVVAEESVLGDTAALEEMEARPRSLRGRILYLVVMFVLRFDIPVKVPSRDMLPTGEASIGELADRWRETHDRLRAYLRGRSGRAGRDAVFRHPVCGPMKPSQALWMLEVHLHRHIRQIDGIQKAYMGR